jgi:hypothetical protein
VNILLLKKFRFAQSDEKFLRENNLPIRRAIDIHEIIVTRVRIFLTQKICEQN